MASLFFRKKFKKVLVQVWCNLAPTSLQGEFESGINPTSRRDQVAVEIQNTSGTV